MNATSETPTANADETLLANVHPENWINPPPAPRYNLVVLGAGVAGLVCAAGAAGLGAKVALVESNRLGGDCLNYGCVPSKALLRCARAAGDVRDAAQFGVHVNGQTDIAFDEVMRRLRSIRAELSANDAASRFRDLGVDVFIGKANFTGPRMLEVAGSVLNFSKAVVATGTGPTLPQIPGLIEAEVLTNETIFDLTVRPERLIVVGGGPIGCEMAQAFQRLGSKVTLLERSPQILPREDAGAVRLVMRALERDGVTLRLNASVTRIDRTYNERIVALTQPTGNSTVRADAILVAVGRTPNVQNLGLETAGIEFDAEHGVKVDDTFRTTNSRVYAAGDICSQYKFTHAADAAARAVIQNALFGFAGKKRAGAMVIPWCTYTDPELAHVGLSIREAKERGAGIDTISVPLSTVDRAVTDGETCGVVTVHLKKGTDRIAGATIVARHAGELISEIALAMSSGIGLGKLANVIHPYPTIAESIRKAADQYNRGRLTPRMRWLFQKILTWQR